ncbi:MAG: hypothetical protein M1828_004717 [Chrysothrix sp. TS-e1954]|nr:MAG: hypothetical protein M1828_004717 [Chrysothrix sp. TS-e1954]
MTAEDIPQGSNAPLNHSTALSDWTPQRTFADIANSRISLDSELSNGNSPIAFFHLLERLKTTKREGWRRFDIKQGESIADHMYRMSIITMAAPTTLSSRLDVPRCSKMALIHDVAEALVGDITPTDPISKQEKNHREATTMDFICTDLLGKVDGGLQGQEMRAVWQEYEDGQTLNSKFVHDVDKIELLLQMVEYERSHKCLIDLSEFVRVAQGIVLDEVRVWCNQVLGEREALWRGLGKSPSASTAQNVTQNQ